MSMLFLEYFNNLNWNVKQTNFFYNSFTIFSSFQLDEHNAEFFELFWIFY